MQEVGGASIVGLIWRLPTPCCWCGFGFETSSCACSFCFVPLFSCSFRGCGRLHGSRVARWGACGWDQGSWWAAAGSCGGLILFLLLVGGSRVPNGIPSGWDKGAAGISMEKPRSTYRKFLNFSPLNWLICTGHTPLSGEKGGLPAV